MANWCKKCDICGKRKRKIRCSSLTPSPYEIKDAEICITIEPQPPTKICTKCLYLLKAEIDKLFYGISDIRGNYKWE